MTWTLGLWSAIVQGQTLPCPPGNFASLPVDCGECVATSFTFTPLGNVVTLVDTRNPIPTHPNGANWCAPMWHNDSGPPNQHWTAANLGQVFGVTLDGALPPNIFVTATTAYGSDNPAYYTGPQCGGAGPFLPNVPMFGPGGPGAVYRIDGVTGAITVHTVLPNGLPTATTGPALGDISFDPASGKLFVSNFDDGYIYAIDPSIPGTAGIVGIFQHTSTGGVLIPTSPPPTADGVFAPLGSRPWGLGVLQGRLYYGVWAAHLNSGSAGPNTVWSVAIAGSSPSVFTAGSGTLEVTVPPLNLPCQPVGSNPVAGIAFSSAGRMMLSERTMCGDVGPGNSASPWLSAHRSRVLEYEKIGANPWTPTFSATRQFNIGVALDCGYALKNAAGGSDFFCDDRVVSTGDLLAMPGCTTNPPWPTCANRAAYGLQITPVGGNAPATPASVTANGLFIDLNNSYGTQDKTQIGDVVVNRGCCKCVTYTSEGILCVPGSPGSYVWTFRITNNTTQPMQYLQLPAGDPHFTTHTYFIPATPPGAPLQPGATSGPIIIPIIGVPPGSEFCFDVTFATPSFEECCRAEKCMTMPECDCLQFPRFDLACDPGVPGSFTITFTVQNLGIDPVNQFYIVTPPASSITAVPDSYAMVPDLLPGATSGVLTTTITGAIPGSRLCLKFTFNHDCDTCCDLDYCFTVPMPCPPGTGSPPCTPGALCYADCDGSGHVNVNDFVCFINHFGAEESCANCDESTSPPILNVNDFICFQQRFAAGCP